MSRWAALMTGRRHLVVAVLGLVLVVLALVVVLVSETRLHQTRASIGGVIHDLGSPTHDINRMDVSGKLVRISGMPKILTPPMDPQFGVRADAPVLTRSVEMSQWHESNYGGGPPSYQRDWLDYRVDSSKFVHPRGHTNPQRMPFHGRRFQASDVRIAGLKLAPGLVYAIPGEKSFPPQMENMPANLAATFALRDGKLWSNPIAGSPQLGDLRVSWTIVPDSVLTIVARVTAGELVPAEDLPGAGFSVFLGDVPLDVLMPGVPRPPSSPWLWRVLALVLMIGGYLLLSTLRQRPRDLVFAAPATIATLALAEAFVWWSTWRFVALLVALVIITVAAIAYWRRRAANTTH